MGELYIKYEYWIAAFQLVFAMLGMGATLTIEDFKSLIKMPKAISFGLLIQLSIVPLTAFLFIQYVNLTAGLIIGIALIAAIPGGAASNIFTYLARGNIPLSISITSITSLACLITTPFILSLLITDYLPADFSMPTQQIVRDIAFTLLLPLLVGILILRFASKLAQLWLVVLIFKHLVFTIYLLLPASLLCSLPPVKPLPACYGLQGLTALQ